MRARVNFFDVLEGVLNQAELNYIQTRGGTEEEFEIMTEEEFEIMTEEEFEIMTEEEIINGIKKHLKRLSEEYYSQRRPQIDYEDPLCRMAYLYKYAGAHANLTYNAFSKLPQIQDFILYVVNNNGCLNICSLGGGPGSELLGLLKFVQTKQDDDGFVCLDFTIVDKVTSWENSWSEMVHIIKTRFLENYGVDVRRWPAIICHHFVPGDLTKPNDFQNIINSFKNTHIFILNYTISELLFDAESFLETFNNLARKAFPGAWFIIIDRYQKEVVNLAERIGESAQLHQIGDLIPETAPMDFDEQKESLGKWYTLIGWDPQLRWNAFYLLYQKQTDE